MGGDKTAIRPGISVFLFFLLFMIALAGIDPGAAHAVAGDLDPTFGDQGWAILNSIEYREPSAAAEPTIAIQTDGKMVVLGGPSGDRDFLLFRLFPSGALDPSFGPEGRVTISFDYYDRPCDVAIQADGKIVVVGDTVNASYTHYRGVLARINPDGTTDDWFGDSGKVIISDDPSPTWRSVALQADGKIVVAGSYGHWFAVARFTSSGVLDTTFGSGGIATVSTTGYSESIYSGEARDVVVAGDGRIFATGSDESNPSNDIVAGFNNDGSLNTSFASGGFTYVDISAVALTITGAGRSERIYVAGAYSPNGTNDVNPTVVRLTPNGALDTAFGDSGKAQLVTGGVSRTQRLVLDTQGRLVLAGSTFGGGWKGFLARFTSDGALDHGFGVDGIKTVESSSEDSFVTSLQQDSQGRLLCGGYRSPAPGYYYPIVTRHRSDDNTSLWGETWTWSDPARNDNYVVAPEVVTIHANAQQNLWNCQRSEAPFFSRNLPAGTHWTASTLVYVPSQKQDTMAGLMLWNGQESGQVHSFYVGLADVQGTPWVIAQGSLPVNCAASLPFASYALDSVVVAITRSGNDYTFSSATPFGPWTELGTITTTADFTKVGFMAKSWGNNDIEAQFSFFDLQEQ